MALNDTKATNNTTERNGRLGVTEVKYWWVSRHHLPSTKAKE